MFSLFLSLGAPYQMITPEQWSESGSGVYTLFNNRILWTISSTFYKIKDLFPNVAFVAKQLDGLIAGIVRSILSDWIVQLTVSKVFCSELLPLGLSRFCSSFRIRLTKDENLTTVQVMFKFLQTYTWLSLLRKFLCFDQIKSLSNNLPWQNDC